MDPIPGMKKSPSTPGTEVFTLQVAQGAVFPLLIACPNA
jgi:hypothetical protein